MIIEGVFKESCGTRLVLSICKHMCFINTVQVMRFIHVPELIDVTVTKLIINKRF